MRQSRDASQLARARAARRERARAARRVAQKHHALARRPHAAAPRVARGGRVAEHGSLDAPSRAPTLVGGQRLEVALEEREQRLVGGRINRVVEEEARRVLAARGASGEPLPEQLTVRARVLRADKYFADAEVRRVAPLAARESARDCADRRADVRRRAPAVQLPRDR